MLGEVNNATPRLRGKTYWTLLILQVPLVAMWASGYNGLFFLLYAIAYMGFFGILRYRTTSYRYGFGMSDGDAALARYQEKPWMLISVLFVFATCRSLLGIAIVGGGSAPTVLAAYGGLFAFVVLALAEAIRKVKL